MGLYRIGGIKSMHSRRLTLQVVYHERVTNVSEERVEWRWGESNPRVKDVVLALVRA